MTIQLSNIEKFKSGGSTYNYFVGICENRKVTITIVTGQSNYVNVAVHNASHRAWRGLGKDFSTLEAAVDNYKDEKIKAIINAVKEEAK